MNFKELNLRRKLINYYTIIGQMNPILEVLQKRHERLVKLHQSYAKTRKLDLDRAWKRDLGFLQTFLKETSLVRLEVDEKSLEELQAKCPVKVVVDPELLSVVKSGYEKMNAAAERPTVLSSEVVVQTEGLVRNVPPEDIEPQI